MFRPLSFLFPLNPSRQLHRILCSSLLICPLNSKMKMSINLDVNSMASRLTRDLEVRYENIRVVAECEVVHGKPLPTTWNYTFGYCRNFGDEQPSQKQRERTRKSIHVRRTAR
ncbi:hypothetical protein Hanom_Chr11g01044681 [Helianthus anomalus]